VLFILLFVFFNIPLISQKSGVDVETKIAIEKNLEERLKRILAEITGTDKIIIVINVQLMKEGEEKVEEEEIVLPGVPLQKKLGMGFAEIDFTDTSIRIKKIFCQIIVDKTFSDSIIKVMENVAKSVIGFQSQRGDVLEIKKMVFKKDAFSWRQIFYPPNLWGIVFSILGIVMVVVISSFFFRIFPQTITLKTSAQSSEVSTSAEFPVAERAAIASIQEETRKETPFYFLNEENVEKLKILLPDLTVNQIAIILNYKMEFSDAILSLLDEDKANEVIAKLSIVKIFSSDEVRNFEESLKEQINFMVGGEEIVCFVLNSMTDEEIRKYLSGIREKNPALAEELSKKVFTLEKLFSLDEKILFTILKEVGFRDFANILQSVDEAKREEFLNKFTEAVKTRLKEEIEFAPELNKYVISESKRRIIQVINRIGI